MTKLPHARIGDVGPITAGLASALELASKGSPAYWLSRYWPELEPATSRAAAGAESDEFTKRRIAHVDRYVLVWLAVEAILVVAVILPGRRPVEIRAAAVAFVSLRIFDIMQRVMNVALMEGVGENRAVVASFTRSIVLALVNFFELCICFGVIYASDYPRLNGAGRPLSGFYFSVITQLTIGYGDIYPTGYARVIAAIQGLAALVFIVLVFARVVQSLPPRKGVRE
ncbi:MAG: potassium channel family protein [Hyphomicrobium sp.]|jgi:hypothetical protein